MGRCSDCEYRLEARLESELTQQRRPVAGKPGSPDGLLLIFAALESEKMLIPCGNQMAKEIPVPALESCFGNAYSHKCCHA
jgi:hypothetical protein